MLSLTPCVSRSDEPTAYCINASELPCPEDPLSNDIIRHPITVGRSVKFPENITIRDIAYVMDGIQQGDYEGYNLKGAITNLRKMTDKDAQRNAKATLPWFCGSLMHHKRSNANVEKAQFQIFDLDHVANPEAIKQIAISKLPYIRYAFLSAVDGVKLIAQFAKPITVETVYKRIYTFLALQIEWAVKHICDFTSDWSRACFMSYDPNLLINHHCQALDPSVTYKQACSVMEIPFPKDPNSKGIDTSTFKLPPNISKPDKYGVKSSTDSDYAKAEQVISVMSQITISYRDWIKLGQALYAGFGEQGKALWDMFLSNPNYQDTQRQLDVHWHSFRSVHSVRLASLFYVAEKYGVKL